MGASSPRDLYVSWNDWRFDTGGREPTSPLGSLAYLVLNGATVLETRRAPVVGDGCEPVPVVVQRTFSSPEGFSVDRTDETPAVAAFTSEGDIGDLRARILARIPAAKRESLAARRLVDELVARAKVFGPINVYECTEEVEFHIINGEPETVSFRVPISRKAQGEAALAGLREWLEIGISELVPWDTPSYGFVIVVPKSNGKFRVTISPKNVNNATKRVDPEGGYMPSSMLYEAQRSGRQSVACTLDMANAFLTLKLGPTARRLSTFTTPLGKMRWKNGWFGWHSFPAVFQRVVMEKVVLPALDKAPTASIMSWIDDMVVGEQDDMACVTAVLHVVGNVLAIGGRLNLEKCNFLVVEYDWCGVEVNLPQRQWRIARHRVQSLADLPVPTDREGLHHVLGILRYYFFGVSDQHAQRKRLAVLSALDVHGVRLREVWTRVHTTAMREALDAVINGDWVLVFDPTRKVFVTTDASGEFGYSVVAYQFDDITGKMRPVSFFSKGWEQTQLRGWTPMVKECYAQRQAVAVVMPSTFPYADVVLLTDSQNLAARTDSADKRVQRWQLDINAAGCITRRWIPGEWNTIADYGSRAVVPDATAVLSEEEQFELHLYSIALGEGEDVTAVQGHLPMAPMVAKIAAAQDLAGEEERSSWTGAKYSTATLGGRTLHVWDNRLIVPRGAANVKSVLMKMAHDDDVVLHYPAAERTLHALRSQARVYWVNMDADVKQYVASCFKCQFAKANSHGKAHTGTLSPTIAPHVHHTWYVDLKGPMPGGMGYIMAVIEAISRGCKLRYLPRATATEVCEELEEAFVSFGTRPVVLRSDSGPPFDSNEFKEFCAREGVTPVLGVPYHSQGQGLVESRFRGIAASIMAALGGRATQAWLEGPFLGRLEGAINSTICGPAGGSPTWVLTGREPRTRLASAVDWSSPSFGDATCGVESLTLEVFNEVIAAHHAAIDRVQGRVSIATSLAQALTKRSWDASRQPGAFVVDEWVLVHTAAPNRLTPWFAGPYQVVSVSSDGNFVRARHFLEQGGEVLGPFHVSRLLHFDMSRATTMEIAAHQLEAGSAIVENVLGHRTLDDGTNEFHIRWLGIDVTSWLAGAGLKRVLKVIDYCRANGLPSPGTGSRVQASAAPAGGGRGNGGRGGVGVVARAGVARGGVGVGARAGVARGGAGARAGDARDGDGGRASVARGGGAGGDSGRGGPGRGGRGGTRARDR